jgi:tagaturonate epimerase
MNAVGAKNFLDNGKRLPLTRLQPEPLETADRLCAVSSDSITSPSDDTHQHQKEERMHISIQYLLDHDLLVANLALYKTEEGRIEAGLYLASLQHKAGAVFALGRDEAAGRKFVVMVAANAEAFPDFPGQRAEQQGYTIAVSDLTPELGAFLRREFPFTAPQSLRGKDATIGTGDRLGLANPAHIRAVRAYDIFPVLAQQSIRELNFTKRAYPDVLDAATFAVFQEGYEDGYGFDGDHLKTIPEITMALEAGATMITLDLSEVMNAAAATWSAEQLSAAYQQLPADEIERLEAAYLTSAFTLQDGSTLRFDANELERCCVMYLNAIDFAKEVYDLLVETRGPGNFDFEMSIDETAAPTVPQHHLFIIQELIHRGVEVESLAPRFIGEFQKAIDYIGDLDEFEAQFKVHCQIAKTCGNYKVSIHSGSDKFSAYPIIGEWTAGRLHVKTAGTSWLEAVRVIALREPALYREIHALALDSHQDALKFYHITADFGKIAPLDSVSDADLPAYLDQPESRQLLHIIYGYVMQNADLRQRLYAALFTHEELHYHLIRDHLRKHVTLLGRPRKA